MPSSSKRRKDFAASSTTSPSSNNNKQHIRFDDNKEKDDHDDRSKKKDDGVITTSSSTTTPNNDLSSKSHKRKKKRKRTASTSAAASSNDINNLKNNQDKIFNGLILALSTDNKVHQSSTTDHQSTKSCTSTTNSNNNNDGDDQYETLKSLKTILIGAGATISPQVHKRVHYLICTQSAIENLTQRIRQAIKRNVDIVSVDWVKNCIQEKKRVEVTSYVCNEVAREIMMEKERETKANTTTSSVKHNEGYDSDIPQDDNGGWSEPVQLDCCCVCHENGDDKCPWCTDCNINLAKKQKLENV
ncbi:hypothetical protein ACHAWT_006318 [Skeletonema menzelii]